LSRCVVAARRCASRWTVWPSIGLSRDGAATVDAMASPTPAQPGPPAPPPVTDIDLSEFADIVNNARTDDERALTTPLVATLGAEYPDLAYRGSTMVFDKDHLAW